MGTGSKMLKTRGKSVNALLLVLGLGACGFDPNIPDQTTYQVIDSRRLTVGYVDGVLDPVSVETPEGEVISPFPIVGADGIRVVDEGDRALTGADEDIAFRAAVAHCGAFGQRLAVTAGVYYPAEAGWLFGRCAP